MKKSESINFRFLMLVGTIGIPTFLASNLLKNNIFTFVKDYCKTVGCDTYL
jgi:hypothetical protein